MCTDHAFERRVNAGTMRRAMVHDASAVSDCAVIDSLS